MDERVNAEKIIGNASFFMYAIPIYYMTINKISEIGEASVPNLHLNYLQIRLKILSNINKSRN